MGEAGKDEWKNRFKKREPKKLLDMMIILILVMVEWMHAYVKIHQIVHFKYVAFIVYQL